MVSLEIDALSKRKSLDESKITKMTMVIVGIFICFTSVPLVIVYLLEYGGSKSLVLRGITHVLLTTSSSVNAIIYGIFNKKFRNLFIHHFWTCRQTNGANYNFDSSRGVSTPKVSLAALKKISVNSG